MYVKHLRPLDPWLNLASLMRFSEVLPPLPTASPQAVTDVNQLWADALANHPELAVPPVSGSNPELNYEVFRRVREYLGVIATVASDAGTKRPASRYGMVLDPRLLDLESLPPSDRRRVSLCGSGIFVSTDLFGVFLNCLEQTSADIWALQNCPVCARPFLPFRDDQKACSPRCANVRRVREVRARKKTAPVNDSKKQSQPTKSRSRQ